MPFLTDQSAWIALSRPIAEGERSELYEVTGYPELVAKVYRKPPPERIVRRLQKLIEIGPGELDPITAWPLSLIRAKEDEPVRGFLMRRIHDAQPLTELESPCFRPAAFAQADWRFLIQTAQNCAQLVEKVHQSGLLLGDVQSRRFLVDNRGEVQLIRCESFQVALDDTVHCCDSAAAEYLAPELHTMPLDAFVQSANHDYFGLAAIIFRLIMLGRHPFVGYQGNDKLSIARSIQEYRYAWGSSASSLLMTPPPHSLQLSDLPPEVAQLFQQAFSRGSEREEARPTARQWIGALSDMERQLKSCSADPGHVYLTGSQCPWCRIEAAGGPAYFASIAAGMRSSLTEPKPVKQLANRLAAIEDPQVLVNAACNDDSPLPISVASPLPAGAREFQQVVYALIAMTVCSALVMLLGLLSTTFFYIGLICTIGAALGTAMAGWQAPLPRIRKERKRRLAEAKAALANAQQFVRSQTTRLCADFAARLKTAAATRDELQSLQDQESRELKLLQATVRERQLDDFLGGCLVRTASLNKLTPDRVLILQSYGVESARQVTEKTIAGIHGIGQTLPSALIAWRKALEAKFNFDDRRGLPPADASRVKHRYIERRLALQEEFEVELEQLAGLSTQGRSTAEAIKRRLKPLRAAVEQASANLRECSRHSQAANPAASPVSIAEDEVPRRAAG